MDDHKAFAAAVAGPGTTGLYVRLIPKRGRDKTAKAVNHVLSLVEVPTQTQWYLGSATLRDALFQCGGMDTGGIAPRRPGDGLLEPVRCDKTAKAVNHRPRAPVSAQALGGDASRIKPYLGPRIHLY